MPLFTEHLRGHVFVDIDEPSGQVRRVADLPQISLTKLQRIGDAQYYRLQSRRFDVTAGVRF